MEQGRLSNAEFARCLRNLLDGKRLPADVPPEDAADLALAKRLNDLRRLSSRLVVGNLARQKEIELLVSHLDRLRPVERQVLAFHLGGGYSLATVAQVTRRSETNTISCLRNGLRTLRRYVDRPPA